MTGDAHSAIRVKDCSKLILPEDQLRALLEFSAHAGELNVFKFKMDSDPEDSSVLVEYEYKNNAYWTGRYVGEATFSHLGKDYHLRIDPRFGELFLFRMFEEIFNIRLAHSKNKNSKAEEPQFLIRKLITFVWVQLLADANKHGIPKNTANRTFEGARVKGRINVRGTVHSLSKSNVITSMYREKAPNSIIGNIILQAYKILLSGYGLDGIRLPDNARDAVNELFSAKIPIETISGHAYKGIVYKDIYFSYKALVDFSWEIIQRKNILLHSKENKVNKGFSFFIDIAEVWELYLKSLLKKRLQVQGWKQVKAVHPVYGDKFFRKTIIPDMVFEKETKTVVWDAKYKRMYFYSQELDREDFFQIHTYSSYYQNTSDLVAAGLLYPIVLPRTPDELLGGHSDGLFGIKGSTVRFVMDGVDISFLADGSLSHKEKMAFMKQKEAEFLDRMMMSLPD